ncbi:MAG: anaerobic ribonucleoside-triphosphate reductase activating protein [Bacteroidales bacterium]|nr:anaerobic ribonucleoside-triphosphate reductase activating protein [Bacteroidales bacterium]MDY5262268.1 anaerobic ribonucleoside-triphosphate reductase activating protein [Candidatus Cryptobacteroides sp.]
MIKYVPEMTNVVLEEIPDRLTLAIDISNCTGLCEGCHSPFLRRDVGVELTPEAIDSLIAGNFGINCFLFLGEGNDHAALMSAANYVRRAYPSLALGLYSGRESVEEDVWELFDYVKIGPFRPSCGPLNKTTTNQRLYRILHNEDGTRTVDDITARFWRKGIDPNRPS